MIRSTPGNARRLERVLLSFGLESLGLKAADFTESYQLFQLGIRPDRIDILTSLIGVPFEEVWASRVQGSLGGVPVSFLGREALIQNKRSDPRPQDRADLEALEHLNAPDQQGPDAGRQR